MTIDPQAAKLLRMLGASGSERGQGGIAERRRAFDGLMRLSGPPPPHGTSEDRFIDGPGGPLRLRLYIPGNVVGPPRPGLVYFHGGGLVAGSLESYDTLCRTLAHHGGCGLVSVDYRLAPESRFPAAIEDALRAVSHVLDNAAQFGLDAARIAVGGDSAGGTLTAVVTQRLRARRGARPCCQLLLCPVLDFAGDWPSRQQFGEGYLLDAALMARDLDTLAPDLPLDDPAVSPLRATDLTGLPPALIHTAGFDPLRDEGRAYADLLGRAGVEVRSTCHESMVHHFYGLGGMLPAARPILAEIGMALAESLRAAIA